MSIGLPHGGLTVGERDAAMAEGGKAEEAYRRLEDMIMFQKLEPGTLVSEAQLTELTGFGRTPVREALQRLARQRMVQIYPNRGVLIPATSVEEQLRLLELRRSLEALAVRLACKRATDVDQRSMQEMVATLERGGFSLLSYAGTVRGTHDLIARASHNDYLAEAIAPLQGLSRRFWIAHVRDETREIAMGARLHLGILTGVLAADVDAAVAGVEALNDYLVQFAYSTIESMRPEPGGSGA